MPSFRILNQAPQYLLASGQVNAGGSLTFYETDLTTLKATWSDPDLTTLNANPVELDAAGRTTTDVWGDGEYGVVLKDSLGATVWTRNNVQATATGGLEIPSLEDGKFLTNDGSVLLWGSIVQVPDPVGQADKVLYSDGEIAYWGELPTTPDPADPDIVVGVYRFQAGNSADATKKIELFGTATAAATGTKGTSVTVTLPETITVAWMVTITVMVPQATSSGAMVDSAAINWTPGTAMSSFTAVFNVSDDDSNPAWTISENIDFAWKAEGTIEVAAE